MQIISHAGVLPYRVSAGKTEYLLITSRGTGRWIIPKGRRERKLDARQTARKEGFEEAGIAGSMAKKPLGSFRVRSKDTADSFVVVYALRVERQARSWPEKRERQVKWFRAERAIANVHGELGKLIRTHARLIAARGR
jgi:8-oxo-dGTP pyrophosphatase MutT (NUDIX family)